MPVTCAISDGVALITIDNPPVNVIGQAVRTGLLQALDQAANCQRIIITGAGRAFAAGADAKEFGGPPVEPHLPEVLARLERLPCIAALNGAALGGGLEIALACRARIAAPQATLGLPEVTLGVVPGAGGTQRLPRLIGIAAAVSMICEGRSVKPAEALASGLIDAIAADPVAAARHLDAFLLARPAVSDLPAPKPDAPAIAEARKQAAKRRSGQIAPVQAAELVEAAAALPFAEGMALERQTFLSLRAAPEAAALRHVFFAERAAMSQSRTLTGKPAEVTAAVVVGGGTMGAGIAYALMGIGIHVTLVETDAAAVERARANVAKLYAEAVARSKTSAEAAAADQAARLAVVAGYADLPPAQIAIEAAFENLASKRAIFSALAAALPETAVLATNTSYLDINQIAAAAPNPARVMGLHFFSPPHVMKLVEIIRATATDEATVATAFRLAERLGKIPVRAGVCDGFIGNRILTRYRQECDILLIEGALPWQVDAALRDFGMAMGPYEVQDLSGLDIAYANRQRQGWKTRPNFRYIPIADHLVEDLRRLGRKTGAGWYDYETGTQRPSAEVETVVTQASLSTGRTRRTFGTNAITERAVTAMIVEALAILAEGIAEKPADVDLVLIHGYGFPRWRGGLMHYAATLGADLLSDRLARYVADDPLSWPQPGTIDFGTL